MRTIFNDFVKNGKYPNPLKFNKIPVSKEEEVELNKNKIKQNLKFLLPEELIQHFKDEKKN